MISGQESPGPLIRDEQGFDAKDGGEVRGILFIGGTVPSSSLIQRILRPDDFVCAADSGLDASLEAGVRPALVLGDMDSLSNRALLNDFPAESVETHPVDKDESDTEIGIRRLVEIGCEDYVLIGGGEGRLDHILALRSLFDGDRPPSLWYTAREEIRMLEGKFIVWGKMGMRVSYFPVGGASWSLSSSGLQWELDTLDWGAGSFSLSNRLKGERAEIDIRSGRLIQIRPVEDVLDMIDSRTVRSGG